MGLDISAVSQLEPVDIPEGIELWSDEYYDWEATQPSSVWNLHSHSYFEEQFQGLEEGPHIFLGPSHSHRAGSYSGYGQWRDWLAQAAYGKRIESVWDDIDAGGYGGPFAELINFADNEGTIGPVASKKLYRDFVMLEDDIMDEVDSWYLKQHPTKRINKEDFEWFQSKYKDWKESFKIASDGGAVFFH
jgi:hypothetical protein